MDIKKKIHTFIDRYIKGKYHCDSCPYGWECKTSYEYDEWDAGCYIKGELDDGCRLLPPFRFLIGSIKKKKAQYYENHEHDEMGEFFEQQQIKDAEFEQLLINFIGSSELCYKDENGVFRPINTYQYINNMAWRMRHDYDEFAHPIKHIPLRKRWIELIKSTFTMFINKLKPYFCE